MEKTTKATFTIPQDILNIFIATVPMKERSKFVTKSLKEALLMKQREEAFQELDEIAKTIKPKTKLNAVKWLQKDRMSH